MFGPDFIKDTDVASVTNAKTLSEQDKGLESDESRAIRESIREK